MNAHKINAVSHVTTSWEVTGVSAPQATVCSKMAVAEVSDNPVGRGGEGHSLQEGGSCKGRNNPG